MIEIISIINAIERYIRGAEQRKQIKFQEAWMKTNNGKSIALFENEAKKLKYYSQSRMYTAANNYCLRIIDTGSPGRERYWVAK